MRNILLILVIAFSFIKCKNIDKENKIESTKIKDINEIVKTVIIDDSLNVLKNGNDSKMFCEELIKLNITIPEKSNRNELFVPPPPDFNKISIDELLLHKLENEDFFTSLDSSFLLLQNLDTQKIKIDKQLAIKINLTTKDKEVSKRKLGKSYYYYEMTIPLLSFDRKKAYLELNYYCGSTCGGGRLILLKKTNGKWKIMDTSRTWRS